MLGPSASSNAVSQGNNTMILPFVNIRSVGMESSGDVGDTPAANHGKLFPLVRLRISANIVSHLRCAQSALPSPPPTSQHRRNSSAKPQIALRRPISVAETALGTLRRPLHYPLRLFTRSSPDRLKMTNGPFARHPTRSASPTRIHSPLWVGFDSRGDRMYSYWVGSLLIDPLFWLLEVFACNQVLEKTLSPPRISSIWIKYAAS
uniref:Uncharacterized protein n=1 Tax=Steinernema glaseri TaxID=37863 RepID=A0A1I8AB24_9BILA